MDGQRRMHLGIMLTLPGSPVSLDTFRAVIFAAAACNVDEGTPADVLALIAESGSAIVWS